MDGESVPTFSPLNAVNSTQLPATFVLRMQHPLTLCLSFAQQIQVSTNNLIIINVTIDNEWFDPF